MNEKSKSYELLYCSKEYDIVKCASIVRHGGVIVFPTDTVYGIGCDPYNDGAVERVFEIKGRKENQALPILVSDIHELEKIALFGNAAEALAMEFWPGALTMVLPLKDSNVSSKVTAGRKNIAVRIPANTCLRSLLKHCKCLVGTSANISGEKSMFSSHQIMSSKLDGFNALLGGGTVEKKIESTIIDLTGSKAKLVREGAIKSEEIYKVTDNLA